MAEKVFTYLSTILANEDADQAVINRLIQSSEKHFGVVEEHLETGNWTVTNVGVTSVISDSGILVFSIVSLAEVGFAEESPFMFHKLELDDLPPSMREAIKEQSESKTPIPAPNNITNFQG